MTPFFRKTAEFFCFSRKQQRGLMVLAALLWLSLLARVWFHYHPVRHPLDDELLAQFVPEAETPAPPPDDAVATGMADSLPAHLVQTAAKPAAAAENRPNAAPTRRQAASAGQPDRSGAARSEVRRIQIEINSADTTVFMALRGIGRTLSRRFVSYRELLGGYVSIEQLKEVYGIRSGLIDTLAPQLRVDVSHIRKLELMEAAYRDLLRHPYLEKTDVEDILAYIAISKGIRRTEELLENKVLDSVTYRRVRPYLHSPDD